MRGYVFKLLAAVLCLVVLCSSLSSCGLFFDEGYNFVGLDKILSWIYGYEDAEVEDNAFVCYLGEDEKYHVCVNGVEIDQPFKGEVELNTSDDNWFAYVADRYDGKMDIYILYSDAKIKLAVRAADSIVLISLLYPGVLYSSNGQLRLYDDYSGDLYVTDLDREFDALFLSSYGGTVVYTLDGHTYMYDAGGESFEIFESGMVAVGVSGYGEYVYAKYADNDETSLYVYDYYTEEVSEISGSERFINILNMNENGDEVLFLTGRTKLDDPDDTDYGLRSFVYDHEAKKTYLLGDGFYSPVGEYYPLSGEGDVVSFADFNDMYFEVWDRVDGSMMPCSMAYVNRRYRSEIVCEESGVLDGKEKYVYYLDEENTLWQRDLKKGRDERVWVNVEDFAVTEDGDVYVLDASGELIYIKGRNLQDTTVARDVKAIKYYAGGDTLYFENAEGGVERCDGMETEKTELEALPQFINFNGKYSYVYCDEYDADGELVRRSIYYTDNGKDIVKVANELVK